MAGMGLREYLMNLDTAAKGATGFADTAAKLRAGLDKRDFGEEASTILAQGGGLDKILPAAAKYGQSDILHDAIKAKFAGDAKPKKPLETVDDFIKQGLPKEKAEYLGSISDPEKQRIAKQGVSEMITKNRQAVETGIHLDEAGERSVDRAIKTRQAFNNGIKQDFKQKLDDVETLSTIADLDDETSAGLAVKLSTVIKRVAKDSQVSDTDIGRYLPNTAFGTFTQFFNYLESKGDTPVPPEYVAGINKLITDAKTGMVKNLGPRAAQEIENAVNAGKERLIVNGKPHEVVLSNLKKFGLEAQIDKAGKFTVRKPKEADTSGEVSEFTGDRSTYATGLAKVKDTPEGAMMYSALQKMQAAGKSPGAKFIADFKRVTGDQE